MSNYGNHLSACSSGGLRFCNSSKPKTMTLNLIAQKTLFRLSQFFKRRADYASRRNQDGLAKIFLTAWCFLLDTRDKLR
jgi:hypothetical protein